MKYYAQRSGPPSPALPKITDIIEYTLKREWKWAGHITRIKDNSLIKRYTDRQRRRKRDRREGQRQRGRQTEAETGQREADRDSETDRQTDRQQKQGG